VCRGGHLDEYSVSGLKKYILKRLPEHFSSLKEPRGLSSFNKFLLTAGGAIVGYVFRARRGRFRGVAAAVRQLPVGTGGGQRPAGSHCLGARRFFFFCVEPVLEPPKSRLPALRPNN